MIGNHISNFEHNQKWIGSMDPQIWTSGLSGLTVRLSAYFPSRWKFYDTLKFLKSFLGGAKESKWIFFEDGDISDFWFLDFWK